MSMKVILLGPPGAGKGTVAKRLVKRFRLYHLYIGRILRDEVAKGTIIGKDIKKYIERGDLVPSEFSVQVARLDLGRKQRYILDGFPRDIEQAKAIKDFAVDLVVYLDVSEEQVVERLSGRRVCPKDGRSYHIVYSPPKKKGVCDCDGKTKLIRRKDDKPASVRERFRVYEEETKPLIRYYKRRGILRKVDASLSIAEVQKQAVDVVREWFS